MPCGSHPIATNTSMGETDLSRASRASAAPATRRSSLGCGWLGGEAALDMTPEDSPPRRARRQGRADLGREVQEVLVAGQVLQGRVHQAAGAADIAASVCELGLEELKLRAAERGVVGQ